MSVVYAEAIAVKLAAIRCWRAHTVRHCRDSSPICKGRAPARPTLICPQKMNVAKKNHVVYNRVPRKCAAHGALCARYDKLFAIYRIMALENVEKQGILYKVY